MGLREEVISVALGEKVDLVGVARVKDIELAYPPRPAEDLLPGAKTAVVFAGAVLWGALNCPRGTKGAIKDAQVAYDRIQNAAAAVGRFLEGRGFACYFPPASMPTDAYKHKGTTYFAAEWSHRQVAIAARMGVKGRNNLLITPQYGPRVRLGSVLTTAEIEPTEYDLSEDLCNDCKKCVEICPVRALSTDPNHMPRLNQPLCKNHYARPYMDRNTWQTVKNMFTVECFAVNGVQVLMEGYHFSCAECQRVCPRGSLLQAAPIKKTRTAKSK